jgi:hypothetical protein
MRGAYPNLVVIGAMKCGTTALHGLLRRHPEIAMAELKETDFFTLRWDRGPEWYRAQFDGRYPVRGESSPGYTSPDHPRTAGRMAWQVPTARLVYLVRDPVARAMSQYAHHRRDGAETRSPEEAVLDPGSQYLSRSRYLDRLRPFLGHFERAQILVVVQERLRDHRRRELDRIFRHAGARSWWSPSLADETASDNAHPPVPDGLRTAIGEAVADDVAELRRFLDDPLPEWGT